MGITQFLQILYDPVCKLSVGIESVAAVRMFHPGTDMALIDRQRLLVGILFAALVHPACIRPAESGDVHSPGRSTRSELC